jgi:hypothetical protein
MVSGSEERFKSIRSDKLVDHNLKRVGRNSANKHNTGVELRDYAP